MPTVILLPPAAQKKMILPLRLLPVRLEAGVPGARRLLRRQHSLTVSCRVFQKISLLKLLTLQTYLLGDDSHCITVGKETIGLLDCFFIAGKESFSAAEC